ncbi:MAG TPA: hypothetical protein QGF58_16475 [Myxococcota bacterium]|nr:hypothetical protein [Myxococcota bacterium]
MFAILLALTTTAGADPGDVVVNKKNYSVREDESGGKTVYTWETKDGDRGMQPTIRDAKKAAKGALPDDK